MVGFLILSTPANFGQQQRELQHRGLWKEIILQETPSPMHCVVFACCLVWKAKGGRNEVSPDIVTGGTQPREAGAQER